MNCAKYPVHISSLILDDLKYNTKTNEQLHNEFYLSKLQNGNLFSSIIRMHMWEKAEEEGQIWLDMSKQDTSQCTYLITTVLSVILSP